MTNCQRVHHASRVRPRGPNVTHTAPNNADLPRSIPAKQRGLNDVQDAQSRTLSYDLRTPQEGRTPTFNQRVVGSSPTRPTRKTPVLDGGSCFCAISSCRPTGRPPRSGPARLRRSAPSVPGNAAKEERQEQQRARQGEDLPREGRAVGQDQVCTLACPRGRAAHRLPRSMTRTRSAARTITRTGHGAGGPVRVGLKVAVAGVTLGFGRTFVSPLFRKTGVTSGGCRGRVPR